MTTRSIILDTDIGTDVDDAMALTLILRSDDLDLIGITTVYGDTALRARLARRYTRLAERQVPVYAGERATLSGREVWWPGHEGTLHDALDEESFEPGSGVDFLTRTVAERPGQIDVVAIGPLTNVATAIRTDPTFAGNVRALYVMGGRFDGGGPEHNFRSDARAASIVFAAGIPTVVTGLEITTQVRVAAEQVTQIAGAGPLGAALAADIGQFWSFTETPSNVPHDPIAVLTAVEPELFELSDPGGISVELTGPDAGRSDHTATGPGRNRVVTGLRADAVAHSLVSGIASGRPRPVDGP